MARGLGSSGSAGASPSRCEKARPTIYAIPWRRSRMAPGGRRSPRATGRAAVRPATGRATLPRSLAMAWQVACLVLFQMLAGQRGFDMARGLGSSGSTGASPSRCRRLGQQSAVSHGDAPACHPEDDVPACHWEGDAPAEPCDGLAGCLPSPYSKCWPANAGLIWPEDWEVPVRQEPHPPAAEG